MDMRTKKSLRSRLSDRSSQMDMRTKKSLRSLSLDDLSGKRVLVRVDLDVPLDNKYKIIDDSKIVAAVPTIKHLMQHNARVVIASHLGFVCDDRKYSMKRLLPRLSELLEVEVKMANDCIGEGAKKFVDQILGGQVLMLENLKLYDEDEMSNDPTFAKKLASLADLFVNDAFAFAPKTYASTVGVGTLLKPAVTGLLMQEELECLTGAIRAPKKPLVAIVGGARLSTKFGLIKSLLDKVDDLLLGGGIIYAFYLAQGKSDVGYSLVEKPYDVEAAKELIELAKEKGKVLRLPQDVVIADMFGPEAKAKVASLRDRVDEGKPLFAGPHINAINNFRIPNGWMGLDIGPKTIQLFCDILDSAETIIWNGPMGVCEYNKFNVGTKAIAKKVAELTRKGRKTIIAGGDTVAVVKKLGLVSEMSHVSTGQRGSLALLAEQELPGVLVLDDDE